MRAEAETARGAFELRAPETAEEWRGYHSVCGSAPRAASGARAHLRRRLVLIADGAVSGAAELEPLDARVIAVRAAAVAPARRGRGLGSVMTALAEHAAAAEGFALAAVCAPPSAMFFYARNGWRHEAAAPARALLPAPAAGAVWMGKRLDLGVAQSPPAVFIRAGQRRERAA